MLAIETDLFQLLTLALLLISVLLLLLVVSTLGRVKKMAEEAMAQPGADIASERFDTPAPSPVVAAAPQGAASTAVQPGVSGAGPAAYPATGAAYPASGGAATGYGATPAAAPAGTAASPYAAGYSEADATFGAPAAVPSGVDAGVVTGSGTAGTAYEPSGAGPNPFDTDVADAGFQPEETAGATGDAPGEQAEAYRPVADAVEAGMGGAAAAGSKSALPGAGSQAAATPSAGATQQTPDSQEPFEQNGRWYFRRAGELLIYEEQTGQWVPAPQAGAPGSAATAFEPVPAAAPEAQGPPQAQESFWKCPSCGAVNGSTAPSCRMCFSARP